MIVVCDVNVILVDTSVVTSVLEWPAVAPPTSTTMVASLACEPHTLLYTFMLETKCV